MTGTPSPASPPVLGVVGTSGSGKTTLLEHLVGLLSDAGVRVAVLKHAKAGFDLDSDPGKDSHRLRLAGAEQLLIASSDRWVLMAQQADPLREPSLAEMLRHFDASVLDLILAEGFGHERFSKIEVFRPAHGRPPQCWPQDSSVIAVASDVPLETAPATWLDLNDPGSVARFIVRHVGLSDIASRRNALWP